MARRERLISALRGEPTDATPIWLMRQAGRHLPGYRALRARHSILEIARTPELAAEVTLEPLRRYDVDAAVVFADISLPFAGLGLEFSIDPGIGPVVASPVRTDADVAALGSFSARASVPFVGDAIRRYLELESERPIVGFSGGPFTLASYLIEGRPDRELPETRKMLHRSPATFDRLLDRLVEVVIDYLRLQADAGAAALQIFETWMGALSVRQFEAHVQGRLAAIADAVRPLGRPVILFSLASSHLLEPMAATGMDALSVDWREPLSRVRARVGPRIALQGNLDPAALLDGPEHLRAEALAVLDSAGPSGSHVFNLGHGVLPQTDPARVAELVELVHTASRVRGHA